MIEPRFLRPTKLPLDWADRFAYGYGVRAGNLVLISGQIARDARGTLIGEGDVEAQTVQVFENIKAVVEEAGGTLEDIISTRTYVADRSARATVNAVRQRYFPLPPYPNNTLLIVAGLGLPEYLVEIEAVALLRP